MAFNVTGRYGKTLSNPPLSVFESLLEELEERPGDVEHNSVSVTHESEWCISASKGGYVILENLEDGTRRHMRDVPKHKIVRLWTCLASGNLEEIERQPWQEGY